MGPAALANALKGEPDESFADRVSVAPDEPLRLRRPTPRAADRAHPANAGRVAITNAVTPWQAYNQRGG